MISITLDGWFKMIITVSAAQINLLIVVVRNKWHDIFGALLFDTTSLQWRILLKNWTKNYLPLSDLDSEPQKFQ